ncbi:hypothetical protein FSP39_002968 [Pinctada imbricata]|uniref:Gfo/Idh/MocA-like oxidoreductase N-terminal domain-containing protein n=1 Tax=Pinctada imbricata TaxID=66713 RepID=A0AA88Y2T4_PINIB|nr:hypothetical protein FSP39_002968 [Pinctada imbricata]
MSTEMINHKIVTAIIIGAGNRGYTYASYVTEAPDDFKVVAVADPRPFYKNRVKKLCNIPEERVYDDWKEVAELDKFADCVIISTQTQLHTKPAIAFARKGYDILLEKPMAVTAQGCREVLAECERNNVYLTVCHVLRYTPWVQKLKEIIDKGDIGDVVNIQHLEPVGYRFFSHCFVRGNWNKESDSTFSLLEKCCHDLDLISYWMGPRKCHSVSSFGHLSHFNKDCKPAEAASRCLDCPAEVESACPYSAQKIYFNSIKTGTLDWPFNVITDTPDIENITEALRTGPYGRCVYDMDNDVMSQQGELTFEEGYGDINHCDFTTGQTYRIPLQDKYTGSIGMHGGADYYMIKTYVDALKEGDKSKILTGGEEALASHLLAFAAEKARKENRVVTIDPDLLLL